MHLCVCVCGQSDVIVHWLELLLLDESSVDCCHKYSLLSAGTKSNGKMEANRAIRPCTTEVFQGLDMVTWAFCVSR